MHKVYIMSFFFKDHFNIIFPSMFRYSKWFFNDVNRLL